MAAVLGASRPQQPRSEQNTPAAFLLALMTHALLVAALWVSVQWRTEPAGAVVVELWGAAPPAEPVVVAPPPPVGLERAGFSAQKIKEIRKAFSILFTRDLRLEEAVAEVRKEIGESDEIKTMLDAIERSQRGLARPDSATFEMNVG